ncbi:hypothetical protein HCH_01752 [Hahella chejuensis KCTC 2396]|uniref:Uncharacterized protein n=1 Tax=Hahella chejuensis (strain KCTC 2396) TaxID=349521 RepID=Q2SL77_HAHCH|nr:hypothetical protein HCH_01752 [Hahella chejuensis KCTC 2396]
MRSAVIDLTLKTFALGTQHGVRDRGRHLRAQYVNEH